MLKLGWKPGWYSIVLAICIVLLGQAGVIAAAGDDETICLPTSGWEKLDAQIGQFLIESEAENPNALEATYVDVEISLTLTSNESGEWCLSKTQSWDLLLILDQHFDQLSESLNCEWSQLGELLANTQTIYVVGPETESFVVSVEANTLANLPATTGTVIIRDMEDDQGLFGISLDNAEVYFVDHGMIMLFQPYGGYMTNARIDDEALNYYSEIDFENLPSSYDFDWIDTSLDFCDLR